MGKATREATAQRLLRSSQQTWFDPHTEVEWDAPFRPGGWFHVPENSSLYGTHLWEELSEEQRVELTKHEFGSVTETGIWFEIVLMRMLLRHAYHRDPREAHTRYALVETADECRHSQMFARYLDVAGIPRYGPGRWTRRVAPLMTTPVVNDAIVFGGTLYVEAILDALQREVMDDERVQPMVRQICRIHVVEEARHMRYADEEMVRVAARLGPAGRAFTTAMLVLVADLSTRALVHPRVYASVGLDVDEAVATARTNPHWRATLQRAASKPLRAFERAGLVNDPVSRRAWKRIGLLPR